MAIIKDGLLRNLGCPADHGPLRIEGDGLVCERGHHYVFENGVAVFTNTPRREPVPLNMGPCPTFAKNEKQGAAIDPFVNDWIVNTNGNLYRRARGRLSRYPIAKWPFDEGRGRTLVEIGCSWGRWSIAAARAGFQAIGVDVHIDALEAAGRVARQLGSSADFICGDAERLALQDQSVDCVFSYSVLQHLDRAKVLSVFREIARVLKPGGVCWIQLPNQFGVLSFFQRLKRGFREARPGTFEMRYWSRKSIREGFHAAGLKRVTIRTDGFFTQNPQLPDMDLLSPAGKLIVLASCAGRAMADALPIFTRVADSLWIEACAPGRAP
ncbi:MAG TPA: class I SAM-dependent methyltransferase [Candidatus Acidoferrales bacterium]|nr:class I SAM-dependent methyltransferase [Candidatus Acidoferrales bacterium]